MTATAFGGFKAHPRWGSPIIPQQHCKDRGRNRFLLNNMPSCLPHTTNPGPLGPELAHLRGHQACLRMSESFLNMGRQQRPHCTPGWNRNPSKPEPCGCLCSQGSLSPLPHPSFFFPPSPEKSGTPQIRLLWKASGWRRRQ